MSVTFGLIHRGEYPFPVENELDRIVSSLQVAAQSWGAAPTKTIDARVAIFNTLSAADSGKVLTNEGASQLVVFHLPTASTGLYFTFYVQNTWPLVIDVFEGDSIRLGDYSASAMLGECYSETVGSCLTLVAINATEWVATSVVGNWVL